jgi:DNA-binding NarL/FixJ family response regulator
MVNTFKEIPPGKKKERTILIADDHPLFRAGLRKIFDQTEYASSVFFEAGNGREAMDIALGQEVDLIFLDESMPELNGFDAAKRIFQHKPEINIVVLTQFDEIPLILNYFKLGAKGFLSKAIDAALITDATRTVLEGNYYYHSKFDSRIRSWLSDGLRKGLPAIRFTDREVEVVVHLSKGRTNLEIAGILDIGQRSVETYRRDLIYKTGANNTASLLTFVYKNGIL